MFTWTKTLVNILRKLKVHFSSQTNEIIKLNTKVQQLQQSLSLIPLQVTEPQHTWRAEVSSAVARASPTPTSSSTFCHRRSSTTAGLHRKSRRIRCVLFVRLRVCAVCWLLGMLSLQSDCALASSVAFTGSDGLRYADMTTAGGGTAIVLWC